MENTPKNREWVKNAAIIFLVILLILTFFSNTIMNIALPEVSTQMVNSGSITAKVRGTGTVIANGTYEVKAEQTREVRTVMIHSGQEVNAGDVLFVLGAGMSEELEQAQEQLHQLELNYQSTALGILSHDYYSEQTALQDAIKRYDEAEEKLIEAEKAMYAATNLDPETVANAKTEFEAAQQHMDEINNVLQTYEDAAAEALAAEQRAINANAELEAVKANPDPDPGTQAQREAEAQAAADAANMEFNMAVSKRDAIELPDNTVIVAAENELERTRARYEDLKKSLQTSGGAYVEAYNEALARFEAAARDKEQAQHTLDQAMANNNRADASTSLQLSEIARQIEKQKEKIASLLGEGDNTITANVSGTVLSVNVIAGNKVPAGDILCTIEVPDAGYSLSCTVTSEQARRLHTGDTATVSNYYWGSEIKATLASIQPDPKNPQNSKILNFDLVGDVNPGAELTISVGQKSANYDLVIPNSAIRNDSNGSFVLAIEAKNSPLGNRYYAKRVTVNVLASDDVNSAITADLNAYSDFVITVGSTIINSGDQVRMADS